MSTLINNFDRLQNAINAGGAPWFQVVLPADIDTIPDRQLDQIPTAITLVSGANAYNIMATTGSPQWTETPRQVNGRLVYTSVFSFVIPKDRADVLNYAQHLNNRGVVAIVRDANGQNRLMGTKAEPATFRMSTRTLGNTSGNRNEHRYEIVLTSAKPVPFYSVTTHLPSPAGTCPPAPSVGLAVSDSAPSIGDSVTLTATASGITPTSYTFYLPQNGGKFKTVTQASNVYVWVVDFAGTAAAVVSCTDATDYTISTGISITSTGNTLDYILSKPSSACALFNLYKAFTGAVVNIRRSSDNATTDFTYTDLQDGTAVSWVGSGNIGYVTCMYDQSGNNTHVFQGVASYQGIIIEGGAMVTNSTGDFAYRHQNGAQAMRVISHQRGKQGLVVLCTDINAIHSGSQAWLYTAAGNPSVGAFTNVPSSTTVATTNSGTPNYYVDGVSVLNQRGPLGAALIGAPAISCIENADFNASTNWRRNDNETIMLLCDVNSKLSAFISFNLFDATERTTLETQLANQYG